jgi:hypothetical protein
VDAITNTTDESLIEINAVSESILKRAGEQLKQEILNDIKGWLNTYWNITIILHKFVKTQFHGKIQLFFRCISVKN